MTSSLFQACFLESIQTEQSLDFFACHNGPDCGDLPPGPWLTSEWVLWQMPPTPSSRKQRHFHFQSESKSESPLADAANA